MEEGSAVKWFTVTRSSRVVRQMFMGGWRAFPNGRLEL